MSISYVAFLLFHTACTLARYVGLNANEKIKEKWEVHFCPFFFAERVVTVPLGWWRSAGCKRC